MGKKKMLPVLQKSKCFHDNTYRAIRTIDDRDATHDSYVCGSCGRTLREVTQEAGELEAIEIIYDDVYRALYTRVGRLELLIEALTEKEIPIPKIWGQFREVG